MITEQITKNTLCQGVYVIINHAKSRYYFGSSKNMPRRFKEHSRKLKANKHSNAYLQADWNSCGDTAFEFKILEFIEGTRKNLEQAEQQYLNLWFDKGHNCYNFIKTAHVSNGPKNTSFEKRSNARRNLWQTVKFRELCVNNMKEAWKDTSFKNEWYKKLLARNIPHEKLSETKKAHWQIQEYREKVVRWRQNPLLVAKTNEKISSKWTVERKNALKEFCSQTKAKTYVLVSPNGEEVVITNAKKWCLEHPESKLTGPDFSLLKSGKIKTAKGWRLKK